MKMIQEKMEDVAKDIVDNPLEAMASSLFSIAWQLDKLNTNIIKQTEWIETIAHELLEIRKK